MKQKILIMIPVLLWGGTEIQTLSLVQVLVQAGYDVIVCCYFGYDESMVSSFRSEGVKVILIKQIKTDSLLLLSRKMIKMIKSIQPDIVHVQYMAPGLIPIIAARLSGVKTVFATVHQPGRPYGLKAKLLLRFGAFLCTTFFCVSRSTEESWFGTSEVLNANNIDSKRNHFTIYNSIDEPYISTITNSINPINLKTNMGINKCPVVGVVGRLRVEKGHSVLLDAMKEVVKKVPTVMLLVVGDGPDHKTLEQKTVSLGIYNNIIWMGNKSQEEVFELFSVMDVVVVPSLFEGFGLSAAEAMAAGKPVIASNVDGLSEVVENGVTGYLFPPGDSQILAKNIIQLLSNPNMSINMGKKGRKRVKKYFSQNRFKQATLAAYYNFLKY